MSVVRRVPWSSSAEFLTVFQLLFSPANPNLTTALAHLHAWSLRAPSALPPAIHSTHALLSLLVAADPSPPPGPTRRLALAMALTRLVNSLVDPLQTNMFARSISDLARQLELPLSFVQLRHRSTHEELPSEKLLLDSARLAVDWLYARYWYPTMIQLTSASSSQPVSATEGTTTDLDGLRVILQDYKRARKRELSDATQFLSVRQQVQKLETWLEQRTVSALANPTLEGPVEADEESEELERERRVMECLAEELCVVGNLIPRAIKKRPQSDHARLPLALHDLYHPLLQTLSKTFPQTLIRALVDHLVMLLIAAPTSTTLAKADETFHLSIAAWLVELIPALERTSAEDFVKCLLSHPNRYCLSVLKILSKTFQINNLDILLSLRQESINQPALVINEPEEALKHRMERWESFTRPSLSEEEPEEERVGGPGWRLVDKNEWRACPIGMLPGGVIPQLINLP
ncbi:hypothetical protein CROQUDRAFT_658547 [Cronartium quercuum f. sp. fusiforme G11]|uniref:Las1-domain-containing protein n=1 Tax=Cronartium quercuum f. sp. fusiforme G11 TaxID=708437 RepID=A0A9P6TBC4_9BASI|nr:hypothetical protein CROQUDRAFT_658547 [Cronartium quercuum f. sp. fusiforme G11]